MSAFGGNCAAAVGEGLINHQLGQILNCGSFARIYVVKNSWTLTEFALKIVFSADITDRQLELFQRELLMLKQLAHPNIISPVTSWSIGAEMAILLPLMRFGSCADIVRDKFTTGISEDAMAIILTHILPALEYLHNGMVIHRAVKGSHILVNGQGIAILSGFKFATGVSESYDRSQQTNIKDMTKCLNWLSPEILSQDGTGVSFNTDVYSVGIAILELCNGEVPFSHLSPAALLVQKIKFDAPKLWDKKQLPSTFEGLMDESYSSEQATPTCADKDVFATQAQAVKKDERYATKLYSNDFKHFTTSCLTTDRLIRPYVQQLKKHKFMKSFLNMGQLNLIQALDLKESIHFKSSPGSDYDEIVRAEEPGLIMSWDP